MKRSAFLAALAVLLPSLVGPCLGATNFNTSRTEQLLLIRGTLP